MVTTKAIDKDGLELTYPGAAPRAGEATLRFVSNGWRLCITAGVPEHAEAARDAMRTAVRSCVDGVEVCLDGDVVGGAPAQRLEAANIASTLLARAGFDVWRVLG